MGSYENIVKIEEIRRRYDEGDLISAQKVLDTMELKRVKNLTDLNLIAEVYTDNKRYEEAADLYHKIYDKVKSRKSLFQLIDILIRLNNVSEAESYLQEYQKLAPKDFYHYIFRYKIDKIKGESFEHLIDILESLKKEEYTEKWAYELAKLYYKAGMEKECIRECSDLELWFGEGTYVEKARILKSYYSGEADKDTIMEEIKKRAEVINHKVDGLNQEQATLSHNPSKEKTIGYRQVERESTSLPLARSQQITEEAATKGVNQDLEERRLQEASYSTSAQDGSNYFNRELSEGEQNFSGAGYYEEGQKHSDQSAGYYEEEQNFSDQSAVYYEEGQKHSDQSAGYYEEEQNFSDQSAGYYEEGQKHSDQSAGYYEEEQNFSDQNSVYFEEEHSAQELTQESYSQVEADLILEQLVQEYQINLWSIFGDFLRVAEIKEQLAKQLEDLIHNKSKGNIFLITGDKGSGKTTLAKNLALFFYQTGILKSSRLAKIKAEKLNEINLMTKKETLKDCCMVIEHASELKSKTITSLIEFTEVMAGELIIILEEDTKKLKDILDHDEDSFRGMKTYRIHIPKGME